MRNEILEYELSTTGTHNVCSRGLATWLTVGKIWTYDGYHGYSIPLQCVARKPIGQVDLRGLRTYLPNFTSIDLNLGLTNLQMGIWPSLQDIGEGMVRFPVKIVTVPN